MSLANYLNNSKIYTTAEIELTQEPNDLTDSARITDTITYLGNATYTLQPPTTTLITANQDFTPLFYDVSGVSPPLVDYLNVKPTNDLFNFTQLANIVYKIRILSTSSLNFSYRLASYDADLNRVSAYDSITFDPSNNNLDPSSIDAITLNGWSVEIPKNAVYVFMEVKNNTTGNINISFDYANSQLTNAIDNSVSNINNGLLSSRPSVNVFTSEYFSEILDPSGVLIDISILESDVAKLQIDVSNNFNSIVNIENSYLPLTGGTITGGLTIDGVATIKGGKDNGMTIEDLYNSSTNENNEFRFTIGRSAYTFYAGGTKLCAKIADNKNASYRDLDMSGNTIIFDGQTRIAPLDGGDALGIYSGDNRFIALYKTYIDTNLPIQMSGYGISNMGNGTNPNDAVNKSQLDTKLNLAGGTMTGNISLGGSRRITNSAPPVSIGDLANKQYVDNAVSGGGTLNLFNSSDFAPYLDNSTITVAKGNAKWAGGVLAPNGKIYYIPSSNPNVLVVDTTNNTTSNIPITGGGSVSWFGGVLAPNGKIYCVPNLAPFVLIIDTNNDTVDTTSIGGFNFKGKWRGGVLAPNGKIYFVPSDDTTVLVIDPQDNSAVKIGLVGGTASLKWQGGVLAPNGLIYCAPYNASSILVINPSNNTTRTIPVAAGSALWNGGVLAPDGTVLFIPYNSGFILSLDPRTESISLSRFGTDPLPGSGNNLYNGGVLGPDGKIYCMPFSATNVLVIDPVLNTASTSELVGLPSDQQKFWGGVLGSNNLIYGVPFNSDTSLIIRPLGMPSLPSWIYEAYFNKF